MTMDAPAQVKPKPDRVAIGLVFLSGLLLGLGVMLIFLTATAPPRLVCTWPDIPDKNVTVQTSIISTRQ